MIRLTPEEMLHDCVALLVSNELDRADVRDLSTDDQAFLERLVMRQLEHNGIVDALEVLRDFLDLGPNAEGDRRDPGPDHPHDRAVQAMSDVCDVCGEE